MKNLNMLMLKNNLVMTIPLASTYLSTILIYRIAFLVFLISHFFSDLIIILGGLFQTSLLSQIPLQILGDFSLIMPLSGPKGGDFNLLLTCFVPIMIYSNADRDKSKILAHNKGISAIYMWTHKQSGKKYIGSAFDLSKRMRTYYSIGYLERNKSMYICNALYHHGYSAFTLTIYDYIDIQNLSKKEAKKLILVLEQKYIDEIGPEYNILKVAGSCLGSLHTEETKLLISKSMIGINQGRIRSKETLALMSKALSGDNHPRGFLGKTHSSETIIKMSISKGGSSIYVYDIQCVLINSFSSARKTALYFNCSQNTILKYLNNGLIFKDKWKLSKNSEL
jgi:group I intron endonuclease